MTEQEAYHEICFYTLGHGDPAFIHQHVVDAWAAQHADKTSKPIGVTFALAGLYLHVEKKFTGRQVQRAHMIMGRKKRPWPHFPLPGLRGAITALDVFAAPPGPERDAAIDRWCASVWEAYRDSRAALVSLVREYGLDSL